MTDGASERPGRVETHLFIGFDGVEVVSAYRTRGEAQDAVESKNRPETDYVPAVPLRDLVDGGKHV